MLVDHLLQRLGLARLSPSRASLHALQRRWCLTQPFHNLDLLAGAASGSPPLGPSEALERCAAGLGGPCHVHASAFLALVRDLGFDAQLVGAAVGAPDDHLLVQVNVEGSWFVDVGNGQPYLEPFPMFEMHEQQHLGWYVRSSPVDDGVVVERTSPDQPEVRRVYRASARIRTWADFEPAITRHHSERGFGPFLTGLRVVRIGEDAMVTVRDDVVTRYTAGHVERTVLTPEGLRRFISDDVGLGALPVHEAVDAWLSARAA